MGGAERRSHRRSRYGRRLMSPSPAEPSLNSSLLNMRSNSASFCFLTGIFLVLLLRLPFAKADSGDDFSNNFATDIAPLLALFGEAVAKQFMADSMGWKDNIIFAMAPLGIITAIVGAIRVSGSPKWLKSVIGRAREGRGNVEIELMSSTSDDVCELWNGHSIVRVMGSSSVIELIIYDDLIVHDDPDSGSTLHDDSHTDVAMRQDLRRQGIQYHGICSFSEALKQKLIFSSTSGEEDIELSRFEKHPPNLGLNIVSKRSSNRELLAVAVAGITVQTAVVALAGFETYLHPWNLKFKKDGQKIGRHAFPLMVIGTSLLVLGMVMCSHIIEAASTEEEWGSKANVRLAWMQKGATINDQQFESFVFFSPHGHRLRISQRATKSGRDKQVLIATISSLVGFIVQFSALRFLHWSITIAQLTAIAIMSGLRAVVRRNLAYEPCAEQLLDGFELDLMSKKLNNCGSWKVVPLEMFPPTLEPKNAGLVTAVLNSRNQLQTMSNWTGRYRNTAGCLTGAIEALMNLTFTDNALVQEPAMWSGKAEFEWVIAAEATPLNSASSVTENVVFKLKRRRMDGGRWSLWQTDNNKIEALLGLWTLHLPENPPRAEGLDSGWNSRILGQSSNNEEDFELWLPPGLNYFSYHDNDAPRFRKNDLLFKAIAKPRDQSKDMRVEDQTTHVVVVETPVHEVCAQTIFSTFMSQIAQHWSPIKDVTVQYGTKRKWNSYQLKSQTVSRIAENLEESRFATIEIAYTSIIPALRVCGKLPKATEPVVLLSILQEMKQREDNQLHDEAHDLGLWLSRQVEIASRSYRARGAWQDAGYVYLHYYKACKEVYGSSSRTEDAATRMGRFEDIACSLEDGEPADLASLLESKEWKDVKDSLQKFKMHTERWSFPSTSVDSTSLWEALSNGDAGGVARSLREDITKIHARGFSGSTPLIEASDQGFEAAVELLLIKKSDVDAKDYENHTSLHHAVKGNHCGVAELLLLCDQRNLYERNSAGQTPLSIAMEFGYEEMIKMLNFYDVNDSGEACALFGAVEKGNDYLLQLLIEKGTHPDSKGEDGETLLWRAAANGHQAIVKLLLEKGARPDSKDNNGDTPLWTAAKKGHQAIVKLLLEKGVQPDSKDNNETPLWIAVRNGHTDIVKLLLEKGAHPETEEKYYGGTPLFWAAENGHEAIVKLLLEKGVQPDSKDNNDGTPLLIAARNGHIDIVKLLLEKGAHLEAEDKYYRETPLFWAAENGHEAIVNLLLEKGAQPDPKGNGGGTPLWTAARNGHIDIVKLLLEKGAQPDTEDKEPPLWTAARYGHTDIVKLLLEKGAHPDTEDKYSSESPLLWAAENGHEEIVKLLLEKGVQPDSTIRQRFTPLLRAVERLRNRVDPTRDLWGRPRTWPSDTMYRETPLWWAARNGHEGIVKLLLEKGARLDTKGSSGVPPLWFAAVGGHERVVKLLLEKGARSNPKNDKGETLLTEAVKYECEAVVKLLLDHGARPMPRDRLTSFWPGRNPKIHRRG